MFLPSVGLGLSLIFLFYVLSGFRKNYPREQFGYPVQQQQTNDTWPVIFETQLDQATVSFLRSRLDSENIPHVVENDNLFNSGMNLEFGLTVPLQIRVPEEHEEKARKLVDELHSHRTKEEGK